MTLKKVLVSSLFFFCILFFLGTSAIESAIREGDKKNKEEILRKVLTVQIPFIENNGQIKDDRVRYYVKTFGGTTFITRDGQIVYSLARGREEGVDSGLSHRPGPGIKGSRIQWPGAAGGRPGISPLSSQRKGEEKTAKGKKAAKEDVAGWVIKEILIGASPSKVSGENKAATTVNYFKGKESTGFNRHIPTYEMVSLGQVYPGIELKLKAYGGNMEKLFFVKPQARAESIRMKMEGAQGLKVNDEGELEVETGLGPIKFTRPLAYQMEEGKKKPVEVSYLVKGNEYRFQVGKYDQARELIIDPLLASTFLGGIADDFATSIVLDQSGNVYVAGGTNATDFPTTSGAYNSALNGSYDAFISKFDSNLHNLLASTLLGGSGLDFIQTIVLDQSGNVYVAGNTSSSDFPTTPGAYDTTYNVGHEEYISDAFISRFDSNLQHLLASTFLGGSIYNVISSIALDQIGNVYAVGMTLSSNFPITPGAYDSTLSGSDGYTGDGFISKLDGNLQHLLASTFLGGSFDDWVLSIALDRSGNVYVAGATTSSDFPTTPGAYDTVYNGYICDAFISTLDSNLQHLLISTFFGGSTRDEACFIAFDQSGDLYVAGDTYSSDFPVTSGAYRTTYTGGIDAFISKLDSNLQNLLASTFLGGGDWDEAYAMSFDRSGNVYVIGMTFSSDFPTTPGAYDTTHNGSRDIFISKLDSHLQNLLASTFLGGKSVELVLSLVLDQSGNVYLAGGTYSSEFPSTPGTYDATYNGNDAFISKLDSNLQHLLVSTFLGGTGHDWANAYSIALDQDENVYVAGRTQSADFPATPGAYDATYNGNDAFISKFDSNLQHLLASTFLGGNNLDIASSIVLDQSGNVYVTGNTSSVDFPTILGAYDTTRNGSDAFISKLDSDLQTLLASTFLGGESSEWAYSVALDQDEHVYVAGQTHSSNFPTTSGAYDPTYNDRDDAFISKFDSNLQHLLASTFLGGIHNDLANASSIAFDQSGNVYVAGQTRSSDFPTISGAYDPKKSGTDDAFISKFDANLQHLLASTFLGGNSGDYAHSLVLDEQSENVYVAGNTSSSDFPTTSGAYDPAKNGNDDAFISKFDGNLQHLLASTFLGGNSGDYACSLVLDQSGNVYVAGYTGPFGFPTTPGAYDTTYNGGTYDAFISKLDGNLQSLLASTLLGGGLNDDRAYSLVLDQSGNVYVAGYTSSSNFPATPGAFDTTYNGNVDAFISKLDGDLSAASCFPTPEVCDGLDNDCDGLIDEEGAQGCTAYYKDADGDTYGVDDKTMCLCAPSAPYIVTRGGDCKDANPDINPEAIEKCDGKDNNCDGLSDEEGSAGCTIYYRDADRDTCGVDGDTRCLCAKSVPYTATRGGDCNDADSKVKPGATEKCDGQDNDCDSLIDEEGAKGCSTYYRDADGDTYGVDGDTKCLCAPSVPYTATRGGDCKDSDPLAICTTYYKDADGDTYGVDNKTMCLCAPNAPYTATRGGDCKDSNPNINPGAKEKCDGKDNDCDGLIDENCP